MKLRLGRGTSVAMARANMMRFCCCVYSSIWAVAAGAGVCRGAWRSANAGAGASMPISQRQSTTSSAEACLFRLQGAPRARANQTYSGFWSIVWHASGPLGRRLLRCF
ncbi:unnamed protein product [Prorocentrum cordatum]|uniref:Secreted protein n=1 Tax=Prorocentrum cordatum TaxID=2364126 RepID=A0ABN9UY66_9DINO|nr:unnamed protein product [Polarella glacialis]